MEIKDCLVTGKFIRECKNRFLCEVFVEGERLECYVPSASKLNNYIKLRNKEVLLVENKGKNTRTKYSLFAVKHYNKYIMLNLNIVNKLVENYIKTNFTYERIWCEKFIEGYKADFILQEKELEIVEAKGVISTSRDIIFPSVFSERAINQLLVLLKLVKAGYEASYFYVSLSPNIRNIKINSEDIEYSRLLRECINNGMKIFGLRAVLNGKHIIIYNDLQIHIK